MRNKCAQATLLLAIAVLFLLPAVTTVHSQADMTVISNEQFPNPQRPAAAFPHDAHNEKAALEDKCWHCHHMDGKNLSEDSSSEGVPCVDCHAVAPDSADVTPLMDAYHKQCIDCHEQQAKGPLACGECHVR